MKFAELLAEDRRLTILRLLAQAPASSCNIFVLHTSLASLGNACSLDQAKADAAWLAEQGLAATEQVGEVLVLTLTARGADVAAGRASVPGVKRPTPGV